MKLLDVAAQSVNQGLAIAGDGILIEHYEHVSLKIHYSSSESLSFKDFKIKEKNVIQFVFVFFSIKSI